MFIVVLQTNLDTKWKLLLPLATWCLLPFVSYASLRFGEIGHDIFKSIQPTVMALLDPKGAETLRQNREKLSSNITELINEYGPKVFPDFDANYISRTTVPSAFSPVPSRTTSTSSMSWTSAPSKLPKIASGFFQQATRMNWLDDKNIFNWGRTEDSDMADDVFFFLDRFYGNISGRSRSGSVSESDSRSASRNRSRANSISNEGFIKVEGMTSLPNANNNIPNDHAAAAAAATPVITISDHQTSPSTKPLTSRRIFRIDDVEEDEDEEEGEEADCAVQKLSVGDSKKDV
ncbi:hypothetical protein MBANPS3_012289 [Mucor bainieri]